MKIFFLVLVLGFYSLLFNAIADEAKDPNNEILLNKTQQEKDPHDDPFFTGITAQDGNTTIKSGTELGVDPATLHSGFSPEVLPYLKRSVAYVSSGDANVSISESHSSDEQEARADTETHLDSKITIAEPK